MLRIDTSEVSIQRRGFRCPNTAVKEHVESVGNAFLHGYHSALSIDSVDGLASRLTLAPALYRGFAFEGAAMGLSLTDAFSVFRHRNWDNFLNGPGNRHKYVLHVGLGWMLARLPWRRLLIDQFLRRLDPLLQWLVVDGLGFHEGYFHWNKALRPTAARPRLSEYGYRTFDQGLGRSLWFVEGTDIDRIAKRIAQFQPERKADLWSGVGLAYSYAGSPNFDDCASTMYATGEHLLHFSQGITFGAEARELGGIQAEHTERACQLICGMSAAKAAEITHSCLPRNNRSTSAYEDWRANIREELSGKGVSAP